MDYYQSSMDDEVVTTPYGLYLRLSNSAPPLELSKTEPTTTMAVTGHEGMYALMESTEGADFTLKCDETFWNVHRLLLVGRSPVLKRCLARGFKVRAICIDQARALMADLAKETMGNTYTFNGVDPPIVAWLVEYIYVLDYDVPFLQRPEEALAGETLVHPEVRRAQKELAELHNTLANASINTPTARRLRANCETLAQDKKRETGKHKGSYINPHTKHRVLLQQIEVYALADMYEMPHLQVVAAQKFRIILFDEVREGKYPHAEFLSLVEQIYSELPESSTHLREVCVDYAASDLTGIVADERFAAMEDECPRFLIDLLKVLSR